ncbi:hypothetical protein ACOMHN_024977 [Nucella lapillus]
MLVDPSCLNSTDIMGSVSCQSRMVVVMVMLALLLASPHVASWRIDCTRFVFAPRCRGVAAKRADNSLSAKQSDALVDDDDNTQSLQGSSLEGARRRDSDAFLQLLMALAPSAPRSLPLAQRRKEVMEELLSS